MLNKEKGEIRMNKIAKSLSNITLAAMLLLSMAIVFPTVYANPTVVSVDPSSNIFYSDVTAKGDTFTVDVRVDDVTDMYGYEFQIFWKNDVLKLLTAVRPPGHILEPTDPGGIYIAKWEIKNDYSATEGRFWSVVTLTAPEPAKTGSGVFFEMTFEILVDAPWKGMVDSYIDIRVSKLSDTAAAPIPHDVVDGVFEYHWSPPIIRPFLSVDPTTTTKVAGAPIVGTPAAFFDIYVKLNDAAYGWWLIGAEFRLAYNDTLLSFVSMTLDPWVETFGDIYMVAPLHGYRGDGLRYVHTAIVLMPHTYPPAEWDNPISGTGRLVKIRFEIIYQSMFPDVDESPLDLYGIKFSDIAAEPITPAAEIDGKVVIQGYILGRIIDVYTQYPAPYGGQGIDQPSDTFAPQDLVCLTAEVTYNLDPIQNKRVDFEVKWPNGDVLLTRSAYTDIYGKATICFRIPWPDQVSPENVFGIWKVWAKADIANEVVTDTLEFKVDWLMEVVYVNKSSSYQKQKIYDLEATQQLGEMWFEVFLEVRSEQEREAVITVVVYDELGVPIAWDSWWGNFSAVEYCVPGTFTHTFTLYIPTWAYVGTATVYANVYTDYPQNCGTSYGPEFSQNFFITAPP